MRVLLDTNVILDYFLDRSPFADDASAVLQANREGQFQAYISAVTPINVFYFARKFKNIDYANKTVEELLRGFFICEINSAVLQTALDSRISDFEDAVQHASAAAYKLDAIVTRNLDDYRNATIPVYAPPEFLIELKKRLPPEDK